MKKASIAVALVLVVGLFATAFSLAPAVAQYTPPTDSTTSSMNDTSTSGNTTSTNTTGTSNDTTTSSTSNATGGETFSARGSIASLIFDLGETTTSSETQGDTDTSSMSNNTTSMNDTSTSGNNTSDIGSNTTTLSQTMTGDNGTDMFNMTSSDNMTSTSNTTSSTMNGSNTTSTTETSATDEVKPPYVLAGDWNLDVQDGSVNDFEASFTMVHIDGTERHTHELSNFVSSNSSTIDISGNGTSFIFGTVDVGLDGSTKWTGVDALIVIEKNNVISISLATEDTDDHFGGQPIYGVVNSLTDDNGNELVQTISTETVQTSENATGNFTQGAENAANETGEFLGNITVGIQDFFNGTDDE